MLLANYASDSGSDSEGGVQVAGPSRPTLPAPTRGTNISASLTGIKKKKAPVKITLDLPKPSNERLDRNGRSESEEGKEGGLNQSSDAEGAEDEDGVPAAKRSKLDTGGMKGGKGSSALLSMLPPPKRKVPIATDGGQTSRGSSLSINKSMARPDITAKSTTGEGDEDDPIPAAGTGGLLLPSSIAKAKAKTAAKPAAPALAKSDIALADDEGKADVDLFGLAAAPAPSTSRAPASAPTLVPLSVTSAPDIAEYIPPPPTDADPYPGYYQTPSGQWKAYDPEYYHSFFPEASAELENAQAAGGKVGKNWEDHLEGNEVDVDVRAGLEEGKKQAEQQERKGKKPSMFGKEYEYTPVGQIKGLASERHQLSSLLHTAYSQREELEERIQRNAKGMRLARTKYGF